MLYHSTLLGALASFAVAVDLTTLYNGGYSSATDVKLRIGNGVLANTSINSSVGNGTAPFRVAWYKSDTIESIHYLKDDTVDMGITITYNPTAESLAIQRGVVKAPA
ncbi:hypothetical protein BO82DRAFT_401281 [Aspergillus uvarum CBS 121591]|uniref:Uncharacterized protein n=1 Tax=Aspergillus uvarum CBS 121591 TaxID=1448315 RepID=A0A319CAW1_9EURO|nr:hypothetical protein BO82DRAFT_401281 [Aspergillus uvarum CBS 121591]PYH82635.1 hypothetical protein BO82DRAFT_401281 [Aspergillus uvarum CBS 121591]